MPRKDAKAAPAAKKPPRRGKPGGGSDSSYEPRYDLTAAVLARKGATLAEIAEALGVCARTVDTWVAQFPTFKAAIETARVEADDRVERALYERAIGYTHPAVRHFHTNGQILEAHYEEHYPPDTAAASLWLRNRRPDRWRDKQEMTHEAGVSLAVLVAKAYGGA